MYLSMYYCMIADDPVTNTGTNDMVTQDATDDGSVSGETTSISADDKTATINAMSSIKPGEKEESKGV